MPRLRTVLRVVIPVLLVVWIAVSWVEAHREIRVLCTMMQDGQSLDRVRATLDTGAYLRYRIHKGGAGEQQVVVSSIYNAFDTACIVTLHNGRVTDRAYRTRAQGYLLGGRGS